MLFESNQGRLTATLGVFSAMPWTAGNCIVGSLLIYRHHRLLRAGYMNVLPSPLPFRGSFPAGRSDSGMQEDASAAVRTSTSDSESATDADAGVKRAGNAVPTQLSLKLVGLAALAGAMASAAVIVIAGGLWNFAGRDDPRLPQLVNRTADLAQQVQGLTDKIRMLETEGVAAGETADRLDGRLQADRSDIAAIKVALEQLAAFNRLSRDVQAGVAAPALFGVATLQLRDAVDAGRRFDWELVNLRGIAGSDPAVLAMLDRLAPLALTGVATSEQLGRSLAALALSENRRSGSSLLTAGFDVVSQVIGSARTASSATPNPQLLARASLRLMAGNLAGSAEDLQALSGRTAQEARPLIAAAQEAATAHDAVQTVVAAARNGLQKQLRAAVAPSPQ
jgi:hypothetical protein